MAASEKIIGAQIQIDTGNSGDNVAALNKQTASLNQTLKNTDSATEGSAKNFSNLKGKIGDLPGPLGAAQTGVKGLSAAFKALLANPIVLVLAAIVGALSLLYKAFTSTNAGADKMEQIMSGLGAVMDVLRDRVLKVAGAIVKFFKFDFSGAVDDLKAGFSGLGSEIASEFSKAAGATKALQDVEDATRQLGVSRAKLNKELSEAKEIISDENASLEDKRKAIEKVREAEGKQTAQELANAKNKLEAIKAKNALSDTSDEDLQKEADAQAELYALEEKSAQDKRTLNRQSRQIEREAAAKAKEQHAADLQARKEAEQKYYEFKNKLLSLQQENELLSIKDQNQRELRELEIKIENEAAANRVALKKGELTQDQYNQIKAALDIKSGLERQRLADRFNKEQAEKEEAFQKELADLSNRIKLKGIKDNRELERTELEIGYEQRLNDAIKRYKDDQAKFNEVKALIDEEYRIQQSDLEQKFKDQDFEKQKAALDKTIADNSLALDVRRAALDADVLATEEAYQKKEITEAQYLEKKKQFAEAEKLIDEAVAKNKQDKLSKVSQSLGQLSEIAGKQTLAGKAFALAQTVIDTYQSATSSYKALSGIPVIGPGLGAVAAAAAIKSGLDNVRRITAIQVPGQGSGSAPSISPAAPLAPAVQTVSTKLDQQSINDIGNAAKGGVNHQNIRAYVVESDSTNIRERNARIERAAILGG